MIFFVATDRTRKSERLDCKSTIQCNNSNNSNNNTIPGRLQYLFCRDALHTGAWPWLKLPPLHPCLRSYFDALEEIAAVRVAEAKGEVMPDWVPYSASEVCQLCKADFSWASTSRSEVRLSQRAGAETCLVIFSRPAALVYEAETW